MNEFRIANRLSIGGTWLSLIVTAIMACQVMPAGAQVEMVAVPSSSGVPNGTPVKQSDDPSSAGQSSSDKPASRVLHKSGFALTLAGGGARGAAHIGVLKVLDAAGLRPDFISGSSMGALIGGLYAAGVPIDEIEQLALSGKLKKAIFPTNRKLQTVSYFGSYFLSRAMLRHPQIGLYSGRSVSQFVNDHLPPGVVNMEDTPIPFSAAAVDLTTTKSVWLSKGSIAGVIRASNSTPGFFRPLKIGEQVLVDGGVRSILPTEIAEAQGAPIVVAVRLQGYLNKVDQKEYDTMMDYGDRITSILLAEIENKAVDKSDVLIEPKMPWMKMTSFEPEELKEAIQAGEVAARQVLAEIRNKSGQRLGGRMDSALK